MTQETAIPVWGYKLVGGAIASKIHQTKDGKLPKGWKDTPAGMKEADK